MSQTGKSVAASAPSFPQHQRHPCPDQQVRQLAWVPLAYRRTRSRTPPRSGKATNNNSSGAKTDSFRSSGKRAPRRRRGGSRGAADNHKSNTSSHGRLTWRVEKAKDKFADLQKELERQFHNYQQMLLRETAATATTTKQPPGKDEKNLSGKSPQVMIALLTQLSDLHINSNSESWEDVQKTEKEFRQLCILVGDMITAASKIQKTVLIEAGIKGQQQEKEDMTYFCQLSEQLLLTLIDMQNDRCQFVESTPGHQTDPNDTTNTTSDGWLSWLKSKVLDNPWPAPGSSSNNDDNDNDKNPSTCLAHEDPLCGPRLEHLQNISVAMAMTHREDLKDENHTPFQKMRRPQRLQQLFEKMPPTVEPDVTSVKNLMDAYASVGSYESAKACEAIYERYPDVQGETLGILLHAFYLAIRKSPRKQECSKAAIRAEEAVRQKWGTFVTAEDSSNTTTTATSHDQYEENKFVHCAKALLCLHATGTDAIPDVINRADSLVDLCIGRDNFEELFRNGNLEGLWKVAPANLTLPLLNCLVLIYAQGRDSSRVDLAKKLLKILLEDPDFKGSKDIPFPDVRTCKAVVNGLITINDRKKWDRASSRRGNRNNEAAASRADKSREILDYGMEILDLMFARSPCWPDQSYFHSLFRVLIMARPKNAGHLADDILARMHIRQCFEKSDFSVATRKTYHYALRCWIVSAEASVPDAAKRAFELLEMMEAQSLPLMSSTNNKKDSDGSFIYNWTITPDRSTYQLVMKVCSATRAYSEKENALDIALAVDKMMKRREILPSSDTYALLFSCVANLLPEHSKRRQKVTEQLLIDARNQGNVNETVLTQLENAGMDQSTLNSEDDKDLPSAGGLLAGL